MTPPVLLVFATRYDAVTRRTYAVAQRLMANTEHSGIGSVALLEGTATAVELLKATANGPAVIAFYCHGDPEGRLLGQDRKPCWTSAPIPDLSGIAVVAHACRAMGWLRDQAAYLKARLLVGYDCDLLTPANGSIRFWEVYESVHCFIAQHLAAGADEAWIRHEFYELCTRYFHELNRAQARLIELIAIRQALDAIVFL
jgi:hypothetical protein